METEINFDKSGHEGKEILGNLRQDTIEVSLDGYSHEERNFCHINEKLDQNFSLESSFRQDEGGEDVITLGNNVTGVNINVPTGIQKDIEKEENEEKYINNKDNIKEKDREEEEMNPNKKASEWRNELLSFPQLFNQVFLSLYRFNEYIDQRWSVLDESHNRLYNLLLELSKANSSTNNLIANNFDNIFIVEKYIHNKYVTPKSKRIDNINNSSNNDNNNNINNLRVYFRTVGIYIPGTEFNCENIAHENEHKMRLYEEIYNRFQTCKNDIEITFERKFEMIAELDSRIKRIVFSMEKFVNNNQCLLESHTKPLYNIDKSEICEIGIVKRKTGVRGRPPGSGNRGRPPGSTKKAKKIQI
ncbi:uncharacterized protein cubi_00320 [Cryptosporidium ubiquitum]|uniref:Uncharacterized protein n=1 Tax=Cryptosporidium ubiquitum TaxID=857276 RepID=A0A1J4ML60_9CRYT|nr:uncharacterized protein cubi_00320 [Cryptosporidium ubiquitum]OII74767.1 hypothetical protein cubi_00320 [Cryptosporidium ubiquitum]